MTEEITNIEENLTNNEPIPEITWKMVREHRDALLLDAERQYNFDSPKEIRKAWEEYKQILRDLPETYKDLEDLNQIQWPNFPNFEQNLTVARGFR